MINIIEKSFILDTSTEEKDENDISEETEYDIDDRQEIGVNDFIILNKNFLNNIKGKQDFHKPKENLNDDTEENFDSTKNSIGGRIKDQKAEVHLQKNDKSQNKDENIGKVAHHSKENRDQSHQKSQNKDDKTEAQNEEKDDRRSDKPLHKKHHVDHENIDSDNLDDYQYNDDDEGENQVKRTTARGKNRKSDFEDYEDYENYNGYDGYSDYDDLEQDPNKVRNDVRRR